MSEDINEILEIKQENEEESKDKSSRLAKASFGIAIFSLISAGLSLFRISTDSAWVSTPIFLVPFFQMADFFSMFLPPFSFILGILALFRRWNPELKNKILATTGIILSFLLYPIYWFSVIRLALENMW